MKIAIITDDGKTISRHFGQALFYEVFTVDGGKVTDRIRIDKLGHNHFLSDESAGSQDFQQMHSAGHGMDPAAHNRHAGMADSITDCQALICGGMGMGAYNSMQMLNITPIVTELSGIEEAVRAYINGNLVDHTEMLH